jgi:extracellular factor (EF) 3-hydroxypalmitic acid methyl ester biosynthesis protein
MSTEALLKQTLQNYVEQLRTIEQRCSGHTTIDQPVLESLTAATEEFLCVCGEFEQSHDQHDIQQARALVLACTKPWYSQCYFYNRARVWPRGYPGDYETLEAIYHGAPVARSGIGLYLDVHFQSRGIVTAARGRRARLVEELSSEFKARRGPTRSLNVACGSCRELFELPEILTAQRPTITCLDNDQNALDYARMLLLSNAIPIDNISFVKYNALRLVNLERSRARFGLQDIIYSTGLLDYVNDEPLIAMLRTLFYLLEDGGTLIAPFKDMRAFNTYYGQWLCKWDALILRTEECVDELFVRAGIPARSIRRTRERTGTVVFYLVSR